MFINLLFSFGVSDFIMIAILVFLVVLMVLGMMRNRKYQTKLQGMRDDIKVGSQIMTDTGIVGEVVEVTNDGDQKYLTLKSGTGKNVGFLKVHINSVYYVFEEGKLNYAGGKEEEEFAFLADDSTEKTEEVKQEEEKSKKTTK